ncbi:hypothetical protein [Actinopolyspora halophila]|uniref:hypothetical protein n=1 Tax=Actinopolyspora halophila TaxID=1850 RepID=UPI001FDF4E90|nr:hypothetical protein [Actinopolyspora halophila]
MNEESSDEENNPAELAGRFLADLAQSDSAQHLVQPNAEQKHYLMELVQAAWKLGVSNAELRAELTRSISTCTYMTVWVNRLEQYVHQTETRRKAEQQTADQFPACDTCLAERGFGDFHRKVFRDALDPTSELLPCPDCSPAQHRQWITEMA